MRTLYEDFEDFLVCTKGWCIFVRLAVFALVLWLAYTGSASPQQQHNWKKIEADNGAVFIIDLSSIVRAGGLAEAMVCPVDNHACAPWDVTTLRFDCHGHYRDLQGGELQLAPPRSVVGYMAAIACGTTKE